MDNIYPMGMNEKKALELIENLRDHSKEPYKLRYGKHSGKTILELLDSKEGINYIKWLNTTTKSETLKREIINATKQKIQQVQSLASACVGV